jgi:hypothetical protein
MKDAILSYLTTHHAEPLAFWQKAVPASSASLEALCDVLYSLHLAGLADEIDPEAPALFADVLAARPLPGWAATDGAGGGDSVSIHNCAYAFGVLNLIRPRHGDYYVRAVGNRTLRAADLIDERGRPRFPRWLTHHHWRVSHWLGGVPSILWSVGHSSHPASVDARGLALRALEAADTWLASGDGFIKLYWFEPAQQLFRAAYRLRHDPELGDVGGLAHIHWINHAAGRPYLAADRVLDRTSAVFRQRRPFMEGRPYCLDFDVVQLVRTAGEQTGGLSDGDAARASEMMGDLETFFGSALSADYALHKLPGALATYHECATICAIATMPFGPPRDIIRDAFWI